jgi:hypothetical protein
LGSASGAIFLSFVQAFKTGIIFVKWSKIIMKKIAIIVFHFGKMPWYLPFFLKSCSSNSTVDFLFFTDLPVPENSTPNIKHIPFTLQGFNRLASERLGFPIAAEKAYKLCDFRPAFGVIFGKWLQNYDFWGYADTDIILGRIRVFFSDNLLETQDILWPKKNYPPGFFTLYRNTEPVNKLYTKARMYKEIFQSPLNYMFDECGGAYIELENGANILKLGFRYESIHHVMEKEKSRIKSYPMQCVAEGNTGGMQWENGVFLKEGKEILLYHLSDYKTNFLALQKKWKTIPDIYFIDSYNFRRSSFYSYFVRLLTERINPPLIKFRYIFFAVLSMARKQKSKDLLPGNYSFMTMKYTIALNDKKENYLKTDEGELPFLSVPFMPDYTFLPAYRMLLQKKDGKLRLLLPNGSTLVFSPDSQIPYMW